MSSKDGCGTSHLAINHNGTRTGIVYSEGNWVTVTLSVPVASAITCSVEESKETSPSLPPVTLALTLAPFC